MAFQYRTPVSLVYNSLSSEEQSRISAPVVKSICDQQKDDLDLFSYQIPQLALENLTQRGVETNVHAFRAHSHPVCKTIENHILYRWLPSAIDQSFTFIGIKDNKLATYRGRSFGKSLGLCENIKRVCTSKDRIRYGYDVDVSLAKESFNKRGSCNKVGLDTLLPTIAKSLKEKKKGFYVMHDEIHYWDAETFSDFLDLVEPEVLIATIVYPKELLKGIKESLNPWCYTYDIKGDTFMFYPDGCCEEGYEQKLSNGFLLKSKSFTTRRGERYSIDVPYSLYAHSVIMITKGRYVENKFRVFGDFDTVSCSGINKFGGMLPDYPLIQLKTLKSIILYLKTLKKPDIESALAKLRQIQEEVSGFEIKFYEEFAKELINHKDWSCVLEERFWKKMVLKVVEILPPGVRKFFDSYKEKTISHFIIALEPLKIIIQLEDSDYNSSKGFLKSFFDKSNQFLCDSKVKKDVTLRKRVPQKYSLGPYCVEFTPWRSLLKAKAVYWLYMNYKDRSQYKCYIKNEALVVTFFDQRLEEEIWFREGGKKEIEKLICKDYLLESEIYRRNLKFGFPALKWKQSEGNSFGTMEFNKSKIEEELKGNRLLRLKPITSFLSDGDSSSFELPLDLPQKGVEKQEEEVSDEPHTSLNMQMPTVEEVELASLLVREFSEPIKGMQLVKYQNKALDGFSTEFPDFLNGRKAVLYSRDRSSYSYNGGSHESVGWDQHLNDLIYNLGFEESDFDQCLIQIYERGAKIGFHRDDESCYDEDVKVLTVNVVGEALFSVMDSKGIIVEHKMLPKTALFMPAGAQKEFRHSVTSMSEGRVSFTFRNLSSDPVKRLERIGIRNREVNVEGGKLRALDVPGDGDCFLHCVSSMSMLSLRELRKLIHQHFIDNEEIFRNLKEVFRVESFERQVAGDIYAENELVWVTSSALKVCFYIGESDDGSGKRTVVESKVGCERSDEFRDLHLRLKDNHYSPMVPKNNCVIKAISEATGQREEHLLSLISKLDKALYISIMQGEGIDILEISSLFSLLQFKAHVESGGEVNEVGEGPLLYSFLLENNHLTFINGPMEQEKLERFLLNSRTINGNVIKKELKIDSVKFRPDLERAKHLESSMLDGMTGVLSSSVFHNRVARLPESVESKSREVYVQMGIFGSGKSYAIQNFVKKHRGKSILLISPRKFLKEDWQSKIGEKKGDKVRFMTFEVAVHRRINEGCLVILDEIELFPPGYLDLLLILNEKINVIAIGDPLQSRYDSEKDRSHFYGVSDEVDNLLHDQDYSYLCYSRRFNSSFFEGRLPCRIIPSGPSRYDMFEVVDSDKTDQVSKLKGKVDAVLCPSRGETRYYSQLFKTRGMTYGESTGLTFSKVGVVVSEETLLTDNHRQYVALSRARDQIYFILASHFSLDSLETRSEGSAMYEFITASSSLEDLERKLPGRPILIQKPSDKVGKDEMDREERLSGDPWLKPMIFLGQRENPEEHEYEDEMIEEFSGKVHIPINNLNNYMACVDGRIQAKEYREMRVKGVMSEQFPDSRFKGEHAREYTNQCDRFEAIYPRHRNNDKVTFLSAVKKRLRFANPAKNMSKLKRNMPYGKRMLDCFKSFVPVQKVAAFDSKLFSSCINDFEVKKLEKSRATIENHAIRSSRDWKIDEIFLFMKSQLCTKYEKRFCEAKAGQTLACFSHLVLTRFAPYVRYIEKKVNMVLPDNIYIHSSKNFDELNEFVKKGAFNDICTESDYEAFDASQDSMVLAFELCLMELLNLPRDFIEDYKFLKSYLGCKLGNMAIMRFTGEAATFLFNTLANMVFTFMTYEVDRCFKNSSFMFAGDDMCVNRALRVRNNSIYSDILANMSLRAKVDFTVNPTFCGWRLTSEGIFKRPELVLERWKVAQERGNLSNCADNYAIEVSYAYKLGEKLQMFLKEEELVAHYLIVRLIHESKHLLKSKVSKLFTCK